MRARTKLFAVAVVRLARAVPATIEGRILAQQLIRAATSVGANYRAVCRARSRREFIAKLSIVIEECDEVTFWLELFSDLALAPESSIAPPKVEGGQLLAIVITGRRTAESRLPTPSTRKLSVDPSQP